VRLLCGVEERECEMVNCEPQKPRLLCRTSRDHAAAHRHYTRPYYTILRCCTLHITVITGNCYVKKWVKESSMN
jgi:hypothetical protein